ncbi:sulfite exporter TauE/SafE family protein [Demequina sp.]|uniref:sulfite exporter TauE/SafE family protein n=1 Tax=Demequina sp. TaxID=2050685 RepID=UPI003D10E8A4
MDPLLIVVAVGIGVVVGLTGMGGGALMTPALVLGFGIPPLTAVSSDIVASVFMKPVGSWVHIRRGTVNWQLVRLLVYGSVPAAFLGVLAAKALGDPENIQHAIKTALGVVLILAAAGLLTRLYMRLKEHAATRDGTAPPLPQERPDVTPRPIPTILVGVAGGLIVGLTSVGSGSLMIIALMLLYPMLKASQLVGTDLVQAVPLVLAAAAAHLMFGDVDWTVTLPIIIGSIPGAYLGARLSTHIAGGIVRRVLALVLVAAGLKMLGASNEATVWAVATMLVLLTVVWGLLRRRFGYPFFGGGRDADPEYQI